MSQPDFFNIGYQAGGGAARAGRDVKDENAIESILSRARASGDPEVIQDSIGMILSRVSPQNQQAALQYLQNAYTNIEKKEGIEREKKAAQEAGYTYNAPPTVQAQQVKNRQPQAPLGGLGGTPLTPEESFTIRDVIESNPEASSDELAIAFNERGVAPERAKPYVENRRRKEEAQVSRDTFDPEFAKLEAKRTSALVDEIGSEYKAAKNEDVRLDRMEYLDKNGQVSASATVKILDVFGLPIGVLSNPDTEEYRKLESDFVRDVSKVFPGGRITNYEIQSYLRTVPSLMNSPDGRASVIRNRKLLNEAKKIRYDEYNQIIKENKGKTPQNLMSLLEERTKDRINDIEEKFVTGIKKDGEKLQVPIKMRDPEGFIVNIPPNEIERALKSGATFI